MDGVSWLDATVLLIPLAAVIALGVAFWRILRE
jgi:hypothetical protein